MSENCFAAGPGHLPKLADKIAAKYDASVVNYTEPGGYKRHWFVGPNRGEPFNSDLAKELVQDLIDAGILPDPADQEEQEEDPN